MALGGAAVTAAAVPAGLVAGPFTKQDTVDHFVPADKKLRPEWTRLLFDRGQPTWFEGEELNTIGMPVGGIGAGQVYLTGDGQLTYWGIYNQNINSGFGQINYKVGRKPTEMVQKVQQMVSAPSLDQGVAVKVQVGDQTVVRTLSRNAFPQTRFRGEYPIGRVEYVAKDFPVQIELEAFSPFIPLNAPDSSLPATVLQYTLTNSGQQTATVTLAGWLENGALHYGREQWLGRAQLTSSRRQSSNVTSVRLGVKPNEQPAQPIRAPRVLADFEGKDYASWKAEGAAFGQAPARGTIEKQQPVSGFRGGGLVNTFLGGSDQTQGKLQSPAFTIDRHFLSFLVGGGSSKQTALRLLVDGKVVRTASGQDNERLQPQNWNVRELEGQQGQLEIVDQESGPWGHINIDQIELRDEPLAGEQHDLSSRRDFGTFALSLLSDKPSLVATSIRGDQAADDLFSERPAQAAPLDDTDQQAALDKRLTAAIGQTVELAPGASAKVTLLVAWHMPNMYHGNDLVRNQYAARFGDAVEVAEYVAKNFDRLAQETRTWRDTYYDSTLPYWLLDRMHSTVANLATNTCQWWANGRFWAWEGCGCCSGTCGHVWNYEHALARLFPQLERSVREMQDFAPGVGFIAETGEIRFRGENWRIWAGDSQGGYVLKAYREHQMCPDGQFLSRNWPQIRKAVEFLIGQDGNADGLLEGSQHQTYDQNYFGANTMVGSLYLGALRAAEEMAREQDDAPFATKCRKIFEAGSRHSVERLFNGEYFIQDVDLKEHPDWQYADGCLADQLFGQGWAHQVNLGYLYPEDVTKKSLQSIWKYCWAPDIEPQNQEHKPERWFAYAGEAGLFTCTWPKSKHLGAKSTRYRNEIWTGIEYQVANHMAYEGMLLESLAMCRGVHDRYHPKKHNPFNEIECGDHYARAMASWGVLLGLSGYQYHGPRQHLGFAPRMTADAFRCAFTAAEGWGSYDQTAESGKQLHTLEIKWGKLDLRQLTLPWKGDETSMHVTLTGNHLTGTIKVERHSELVTLTFSQTVTISAGQKIVIEFSS